MIETSTQTILFTNCKSRSDNSKSHRVTKYLHKLYHMYYTVVYSRETFDNGTSSSRLSAKVSLIPVSRIPLQTISGLFLMCWTILTNHFADNGFSRVKERSTGWITSSSDSEPLFSFNCWTILSAYQSSNDCRKWFFTAFWTLTSNWVYLYSKLVHTQLLYYFRTRNLKNLLPSGPWTCQIYTEPFDFWIYFVYGRLSWCMAE